MQKPWRVPAQLGKEVVDLVVFHVVHRTLERYLFGNMEMICRV
jgi:hypothetical protein